MRLFRRRNRDLTQYGRLDALGTYLREQRAFLPSGWRRHDIDQHIETVRRAMSKEA